MSIRLIHIAPELPPTVGGVADYTAILSRRLVEVSEDAIEPVLVHAGRQPADAIEVDFPVIDLSGQCSARALAETVQRLAHEANGRAVVLLEYSGYGYAKRGAPLWLIRGLWKALGRSQLSLVPVFHELFATGPPWSKLFWMSGAQRCIAAFLAWMSSAALTNRKGIAEWVERYTSSTVPIEIQPVFSNVGEPDDRILSQERLPQAVVFGGGRKEKVYNGEFAELSSILVEGGINRIIDIGPSVSGPERSGKLTIDRRGVLPKEDVSRLLNTAMVGLLQCPIDHLTKSGVMAAYLAHGVVPIVVGDQTSTDVLGQGDRFLTMEGLRCRFREAEHIKTALQRFGQAGREWYRKHAHSENTAQVLFSLIQKVR